MAWGTGRSPSPTAQPYGTVRISDSQVSRVGSTLTLSKAGLKHLSQLALLVEYRDQSGRFAPGLINKIVDELLQ